LFLRSGGAVARGAYLFDANAKPAAGLGAYEEESNPYISV